MKIPRVDRSQVTPKSLAERWPRKDALAKKGVLDGEGLFVEKREPEAVAMRILDHCVKQGGWVPFRADKSAGNRIVWLQRFVRAALLREEGGVYLITDLFINWLADGLRPEEERRLKQGVVHAVLDALGLRERSTRMCINHIHEDVLYVIQERFIPD